MSALLCWFLGVGAGIALTTRWYPLAYALALIATTIVVFA
jgi:hypothetical protein